MTPAFAFLSKQLSDPIAYVSGPPLEIVHLHSERDSSDVLGATQLLEWHRQLHGGHVVKYSFCLHLTSGDHNASAAGLPQTDARGVWEQTTSPLQPLRHGRVSSADVSAALDVFASAKSRVAVLVCGPSGYCAAVMEALSTHPLCRAGADVVMPLVLRFCIAHLHTTVKFEPSKLLLEMTFCW